MTNHSKHWTGGKNKAVRLYFYSQRGLALFNEFRYLFMLIFGAYMVMKLKDPVWLVVMFLAACPVLVVCGWFQVHHMAKVINWLDVEFGSHWTRYSFELQERQVKATEDIRDHIVHPIRIYVPPIADSGINAVAHEARDNNLKQEDSLWMVE